VKQRGDASRRSDAPHPVPLLKEKRENETEEDGVMQIRRRGQKRER